MSIINYLEKYALCNTFSDNVRDLRKKVYIYKKITVETCQGRDNVNKFTSCILCLL